jgi:gamma-glutamylcyclotransferase (GGCT)/AIG2-like uncharacterized protein YtfP
LQENDKLFVYGTLRINGSASHLMKDALLIEEGIQIPNYKMYSCGDYPTVEPSLDAADKIVGDIFIVPKKLFIELDIYEDLASEEYKRIWDIINTFYIYLSGNNPSKNLIPVKSGDWCKFIY